MNTQNVQFKQPYDGKTVEKDFNLVVNELQLKPTYMEHDGGNMLYWKKGLNKEVYRQAVNEAYKELKKDYENQFGEPAPEDLEAMKQVIEKAMYAYALKQLHYEILENGTNQ